MSKEFLGSSHVDLLSFKKVGITSSKAMHGNPVHIGADLHWLISFGKLLKVPKIGDSPDTRF